MKRNPKQEGTNLFDCIPQKGPCPNNCNQCFYNEGFYLSKDENHFPSKDEVKDGIVRVNSGHDSNINRAWVIESTAHYPKRFFNTSIPRFDFPAPVVFTVNDQEEQFPFLPKFFTGCVGKNLDNLMFVRIRVSSTNLRHVIVAAEEWGIKGIPVVLTFMRYRDQETGHQDRVCYTKKVNINNVYWCPTLLFMTETLRVVRRFNSEIKMCGSLLSSLCKDCLLCETLYLEKISAAVRR